MQKEIWMADLNPVFGSEQAGIRPVIIISGPSMNAYYNVVIICPLTSKVKSLKGCPAIKPDKLNNLKSESQAIAFQIRTLAKARLSKKIGIISNDDLDNIKRGLEIYLSY
jgi:mRNA interferase MazF